MEGVRTSKLLKFKQDMSQHNLDGNQYDEADLKLGTKTSNIFAQKGLKWPTHTFKFAC